MLSIPFLGSSDKCSSYIYGMMISELIGIDTVYLVA